MEAALIFCEGIKCCVESFSVWTCVKPGTPEEIPSENNITIRDMFPQPVQSVVVEVKPQPDSSSSLIGRSQAPRRINM